MKKARKDNRLVVFCLFALFCVVTAANNVYLVAGAQGSQSSTTTSSSFRLGKSGYLSVIGQSLPQQTILTQSCNIEGMGGISTCYVDLSSPCAYCYASNAYFNGTVRFYARGFEGGGVQLEENTCVLSGSPCSINLTTNSPGYFELEASYGGNANYLPSSSSSLYPIYKGSSLVDPICDGSFYPGGVGVCDVYAIRNPDTYASSVDPTGTVSMSSDGSNFSPTSCTIPVSGMCTFRNTTDLTFGATTASFTYSGDQNYYGSSYNGESVYDPYADTLVCNFFGGIFGQATMIGFPMHCGSIYGSNITASGFDGGTIAMAPNCVQSVPCNNGTIVPETAGAVTIQGTDDNLAVQSSINVAIVNDYDPILVSCIPSEQLIDTFACDASIPSTYPMPFGSDSSYGAVTWQSSEADGSFNQTTCRFMLIARGCSVEYTATPGFANITGTFSAPDIYSSSASVTLPMGTTSIGQTSTTQFDQTNTVISNASSSTSSQLCSVTFNERGLNSGMTWSADLGDLGRSSTSNTMNFPCVLGSSYPFYIPPVYGQVTRNGTATTLSSVTLYGNSTIKQTFYEPFPSFGTVLVSANNLTVPIYFFAYKYSCEIGVSLSTSTITTSSASTSLVKCSDIVPLKITGGNISSPQFSNTTIGSDDHGSFDVSFIVAGKSGTFGTSTISIPKNDVTNGLVPIVYVNGSVVSDQSYSEDVNYYYVTFTTHFSTDSIDILFTSNSTPNNCCSPEPLSLAGLLPYIATGIVVVAILGTSAFLVSKRRASQTALPKKVFCRNCGASIDSNFVFCRKCGKILGDKT